MRTRDLKPDFWTDERVVSVSDGAKLMFQGLWCLADREGRLEDKPVTIGLKIRPWDPKATPKLLAELAEAGLITRYETSARKIIAIPNFTKHQRIHPKEMASKLPEFTDSREKEDLSTASRGEIENYALSSEPAGSSGSSEPSGPTGAAPAPSAPTPDDLVALWNNTAPKPLPRCRELTDSRKAHAKARLAERPLDAWREIIRRIGASAFCCGQNDRGWVATFDWLLQPDVAVKVLEGKYDNRSTAPPPRDTPTVYTDGKVAV